MHDAARWIWLAGADEDADCQLHLRRSLAEVRWTADGGVFDCRVQAPAGVPLDIVVPAGLRAGSIVTL